MGNAMNLGGSLLRVGSSGRCRARRSSRRARWSSRFARCPPGDTASGSGPFWKPMSQAVQQPRPLTSKESRQQRSNLAPQLEQSPALSTQALARQWQK